MMVWKTLFSTLDTFKMPYDICWGRLMACALSALMVITLRGQQLTYLLYTMDRIFLNTFLQLTYLLYTKGKIFLQRLAALRPRLKGQMERVIVWFVQMLSLVKQVALSSLKLFLRRL